jgi:hypothetical protein
MLASNPDPDAAMSFLSFVGERHKVWERRQLGLTPPWTDDPILASRKFTNVFRILDHGTQFIMTDLIEPGLSDRDMLMRLFLYRHTGRVEVWEAASMLMGYPTVDSLEDFRKVLHEYRGGSRIITSGNSTRGKPSQKGRLFDRAIFTSAYLVFPQSDIPGTDKLDSVIDLTIRLFGKDDILLDFLNSKTQAERFTVLRRNKGVADFMSMQILTDWGYTPHCGEDRENEFVVPGPGARKGAAVLGMKAEDAIRWAHDVISQDPPLLGLRPPSLMDVQNCLCEFSKYDRFAPAQKPYVPAHPGVQLPPVLPEHWL